MSDGNETLILDHAISILDMVERLQDTAYKPTREEAYKAVGIAVLYERLGTTDPSLVNQLSEIVTAIYQLEKKLP